MKGLDLAREFYEAHIDSLERAIPDIVNQGAFGLVGEGSECFGLDDEASRDHDFGAAFCFWLPDEILAVNRERVEKALARLPDKFLGFPARMNPDARLNRVGPLGVKAFYQSLTGLDHAPQSWREWLFIPEERLACAVNGQVFADNAGDFSSFRDKLLAYYPEDVRLKKIAARVMNMAQSGQYNLPRSLKRGDEAAAFLALAEFARAALSFVFLLNKRYAPYYKLAPRLASSLPILGKELYSLLNSCMRTPAAELAQKVENFCVLSARELNAAKLSEVKDAWLWAHGPAIAARIKEPEIAERDLLRD